jgi:hypothetical protein
VADADVKKVYEDVLLGLDGEFDVYFQSLFPLKMEIFVALAIGKIGPAEIAREARKPMFNISKTLAILVNCGKSRILCRDGTESRIRCSRTR